MQRSRVPARSAGVGLAVTACAALLAPTALPATAAPATGGTTAATAAPLPAPTGTRAGVVRDGTPGKDVVLHWDAPVGATPGVTAYRVQLSPSPDWADTPTLDVPTVATRYVLPAGLPHAPYWWRVRAVPGAWSAPLEVDRAWDAAPSPLATERNAEGRFAWTPLRGASAYQVQFSAVAPVDGAPDRLTQGPAGVQSCFTNHTVLTPYLGVVPRDGEPTLGACKLTLAPGTTYWWRVRGHDQLATAALDVDTTPESATGVSPLPPGTPDKPAEVDEDCPSGPVDPRADSGTAGSGPNVKCPVAEPTDASLWSDAVPFRLAPLGGSARGVPTAAPVVAALASSNPADCRTAADGVAECTDTPEIAWEPAPGATSYRVYLARDRAFSNVQRVLETPLRVLRPMSSLADATAGPAWYVAVQSCTVDGCGAHATTTFRKRSRPVTLAAPADGAALPTGTPALDWADWLATGGAPGQSPAAYRLLVGTDPELDGAQEVLTDATTWSPDTRLADGTWYWRVQPVDGSGNRLPWTPVRSFVVDTVAPVAALPAGVLRLGGPVDVGFGETVTGVASLALVAADGRAAAAVAEATPTGARLRLGRPLVAGMPYTLRVAGVTDLAGNRAVAPAGPARADGVVDNASPALTRAGAWTRFRASGASGGVYDAARPTRVLGTGGPRATTWVAGSTAAVYGCAGPRGGVAAVYVDGRLRAAVDTYRTWTACGVALVRVAGLAPGRPHRVDVVATGRRSARSGGTTVALDGVVTR